MISCETGSRNQKNPDGTGPRGYFPEFITPTEKYFDLSLGIIPDIKEDTYQLKISGAVDKPALFSLEQLTYLEMVEKTLTIECIGNVANGDLVGTVTWKGFRVYDLLDSLGIQDGATIIKYHCADGYFTYNTLEELQNSEVLGALYMNEESIPPMYGYPLRVIFPGYFGVRHPGWVVEIELLENSIEDYWAQSGWKTDSAMTIDSKIFFPADDDKFSVGERIWIGGAAFGSKRISSVEITVDDGKTWIPTTIRQSLNQDYVWIFWEVWYTPQLPGEITIFSRATSTDSNTQPRLDKIYYDGINSWPQVTISIEDGE